MERSKVYAEYATLNALPEIWPILAKRCGSFVALQDAYSTPAVTLTFAQLNQQISQFAAALQSLGVQEGDRISLFADNSARWFVADQGCMTTGAIDVVRSALADAQELAYIYQNSESSVLLMEDLKTYQKLLPLLSTANLKFVGLLSDEPTPTDSLIPIVNFPRMLEMGSSHSFTAPQFKLDQLATLLYTSGTTGKPKGVRLTNANLMHQMSTFSDVLRPVPGDRAISILPTWHSFGRTVKYYLLSQGCTQVYTNIRNLKRDLLAYPPEFMASVPRLWESLYETIQKQFRDQPESKQKLVRFFFAQSQRYIEARRIVQGLDLTNLNPSLVQKISAQLLCWVLAPVHGLGDRLVYTKVRDALGGKFKASVSGGGSLAMHLENFFEIVGINLLVGYGLTETSPVLTVRRLERNLRRSSGQPLKFTELQIVNPDTRQPLPLGQQGLVLARGPQIMEGYYNNPEATAKAIDPDGWFDTGDLGWLTSHSELVLTGRAKDTIVLSNGENIEPQPIEDACTRSPYIDQMMLVGQDQRSIGALIVPNIDALKLWAAGQNAVLVGHEDATAAEIKAVLTFDSKPIQDLYRQELVREVQNRPGYRVDDRIGPIQFVLEPFSIDNGLLTQTLKVRRPVVMERYRDMIDGMFAS
jgi:long-chain acyl-CoA synthetase